MKETPTAMSSYSKILISGTYFDVNTRGTFKGVNRGEMGSETADLLESHFLGLEVQRTNKTNHFSATAITEVHNK